MAYMHTVERANPEDDDEFDDELEEVSDIDDLLDELAKDEGIEDDVASLDGNLISEPDVNFVPKEPDVKFVPKGIAQIYPLEITQGIDFGDEPQIIEIINE